jgi:hypothetical protein
MVGGEWWWGGTSVPEQKDERALRQTAFGHVCVSPCSLLCSVFQYRLTNCVFTSLTLSHNSTHTHTHTHRLPSLWTRCP